MNIVVLDGYTLNPGDLSWDEMAALGNITVYERTRLMKLSVEQQVLMRC